MPAAGTNNTFFFLDEEGTLRIVGLYERKIEQPEILAHDITDIACGYNHAVCVDNDGNVWMFGNIDYYAQLKKELKEREEQIAEEQNRLTNRFKRWIGFAEEEEQVKYTPPSFELFQKVPSLVDIRAVYSGYYHTMFIDSCNNVYGFGDNNYGQLGLGHAKNVKKPTLIKSVHSIHSIACGEEHTIFLTRDREVYACGRNNNGQIGVKKSTERLVTPTKLYLLENIVSVACGAYHTLVLNLEGEVYSFGNNSSSQLGINENQEMESGLYYKIDIPSIKSISCGATCSMILTDDGKLYGSGSSCFGQLGTYNSISSFTELNFNDIDFVIQLRHTTFVKTKTTLECVGADCEGHYCSSTNYSENDSIITMPTTISFSGACRIKSARK